MTNNLRGVFSYVSSLLIGGNQLVAGIGSSKRKRKPATPDSKGKSLLQYITIMSAKVAPKTLQNYHTAYNSFIRYLGKGEAYLCDVTKDHVDKYQKWLMDNGISMNTISCYMRSLRSIYNKAVPKKSKRTQCPFAGVYTGNATTLKRSISAQDINKIASLELPENSPLLWARDIFVFSFCTMGMPFCDIVNLKKTNIKDDHIVYARKKTKQTVIVKIEEPVREIIDRYYDKKSVWLFPFLMGDSDRWTLDRYQAVLCRYNSLLKVLATLAGVKKTVTSYVSRHSWASIANELSISTPIVSQALGHTNSKTTQIYISQINMKLVEEANGEVLKVVVVSPLNKRRQKKRKKLKRNTLFQ